MSFSQAADSSGLRRERTTSELVMCRARLGSKAPATARLEPAQALKYREPGLGTRLRLRPGLYVKNILSS